MYCVQCPIFVQVCPSHQLGDSYCVHAAGRAACEIKYKCSHQFGSPTAQRSLLNLAVQQTKRFRTDLKIFNKNCIIYVSQADVQSERRCVKPFEAKPS